MKSYSEIMVKCAETLAECYHRHGSVRSEEVGHEFHGNQWTGGADALGLKDKAREDYLTHGKNYDEAVAKMKAEKNKWKPAPKPVPAGTHMAVAKDYVARAEKLANGPGRDFGEVPKDAPAITHQIYGQMEGYHFSGESEAKMKLEEGERHVIGIGKAGKMFHPDAIPAMMHIRNARDRMFPDPEEKE